MKGIQIKNPRFTSQMVSVLLLGLVSGLASAADYQLVDLGANVSPKDINSYGEIAGARNTDQYPNIAFRWTPDNGFEDLNGTSANAINDAGMVAGSTISGAFVLDGNSYRSWSDHYANGVNELGNVAGSQAGKNPYRETSIPYNPAVLEGNKWTVMDIAKVYPRGTRQGVYADLYLLFDINENGYAVGRKSRYGLAGSAPFLITPPYSAITDITKITFLPVLNGGEANAINAQNKIVGRSGNNSRENEYAFAFFYDGVSTSDLGTLGGLRSGAYDINDFDQIVGYSETATGNHAFVWDQATGIQDLNSLITASGWVLTSAAAVNNAGDIVGTGLLNGQPHGFLLTTGAVPPPPPIVNHAPVAVATADTTSGKMSLTVNFNGAGSSDPDGDTLAFAWDFGDGTSSTEMNPTHVYTAVGSFVAVLTVDDGLMTDTAQGVDVTVRKSKGKPK